MQKCDKTVKIVKKNRDNLSIMEQPNDNLLFIRKALPYQRHANFDKKLLAITLLPDIVLKLRRDRTFDVDEFSILEFDVNRTFFIP